jgi:uncharacterized membrane protein YphA (DoxX/SURF4 family)
VGRTQGLGLAALRLCLGAFFLFEAIDKLGWFASSAVLGSRLNEWLQTAGSLNRPYLETVCLPGVELFARLVPLGEFATATAFLLGGYTRLAAFLATLMVLNFHFASGVMFQYAYLTNGYGLPVLGGLLGLAIGGRALPFSLK